MGSVPFSAASPPWLEHKRRRSCAPREKTGHSSGYAIKKSRLNTKITGEFCIIFFAGRPEKKKKMQKLQIGGGCWSKLDASSTNTRMGSNESRAYPREAVAGVATARPRTAPRRTLGGSQGGGTNAPCTCSQGGRHLTKTSFCAAGRPNKRGPWHGRSRPPAAAVHQR